MTASRSRALRLLAAALCLALLLTGCAPAARSAPPAADFDSAPQRANVAFADMMAVTTLSLPSMIMLRKAVKPKLLALFIAICTVGIIIVGYLFNILQPLLV